MVTGGYDSPSAGRSEIENDMVNITARFDVATFRHYLRGVRTRLRH